MTSNSPAKSSRSLIHPLTQSVIKVICHHKHWKVASEMSRYTTTHNPLYDRSATQSINHEAEP